MGAGVATVSEADQAAWFGRGWLRGVACGVVIGVALMLAVGRMGA
jgi:hypothetical protein